MRASLQRRSHMFHAPSLINSSSPLDMETCCRGGKKRETLKERGQEVLINHPKCYVEGGADDEKSSFGRWMAWKRHLCIASDRGKKHVTFPLRQRHHRPVALWPNKPPQTALHRGMRDRTDATWAGGWVNTFTNLPSILKTGTTAEAN